MPDKRQTDARQMTAETNRNESKRREENGIREEKPPRDWWKTESGIILKMAEMNVNPLPGETYEAIKETLFDLINQAKAKA